LLCLGLDTTGAYCSAALVDDARILGIKSEKIGRGHAEVLAPIVADLLADAAITPKQIDKITVCTGPGSFTGLRVGLSLAKGFALPRKLPVIGLSALEVWAACADPAQTKTILSVADVKRGQIFWQVYKNGKPESAPALSESESFKPTTDNIVGSGAHLLGGPPQSDYICSARLAWCGLEKSTHTHPAIPLYHRPPDAKLPGGKSLA